MTRSLVLCALLACLVACGGRLPPAPDMSPLAADLSDTLIPALQPDQSSSAAEAADAAVLNDLANTVPDERLVPAFDAAGVRWDIDVHTYASHPRVRYYLDYFQGAARDRMAVFLDRAARFEPMIRARFQAEGLPGDLGYLALIESGYSSEAVSRSYAVGMWQFMRPTGRGYGLRVDSWVDERRDPVKATDAAARYLHDLQQRFGSLYLAAAAYNAGAGKLSRSLGKLEWDASPADSTVSDTAADPATDGDTADDALAAPDDSTGDTADVGDLGDLASDSTDMTSDAAFFRLASTDLLAAETQDYVPKLIAAALIAKEPERYGFAPAADALPFAYDSIVVADATGLDVIARLAGTSLAEMRALNPQFLRLATPPRTIAVVRLPPGTATEVERRYTALAPRARVHYLSYVTGRRERLSRVAGRYHLPASEIAAANPRLRGRTAAPANTRLTIPTAAIPSALAMRATGTIGRGHRQYAGGTLHRVRRGETLSGIARRYRVSVRSIQRVNSLHNAHALRAGMTLRIPG